MLTVDIRYPLLRLVLRCCGVCVDEFVLCGVVLFDGVGDYLHCTVLFVVVAFTFCRYLRIAARYGCLFCRAFAVTLLRVP